MTSLGSNREALGQVLERGCDRFAAAEVARHARQIDLGVRYRDLAVLELADLVEQQRRSRLEPRRRAARQPHLIGHLDAAELLAGRLGQTALDRRQGRGA
ncbi:hypothetical protein ACVWWK_001022 [Bradyrhizobium sp. LB9.1b]